MLQCVASLTLRRLPKDADPAKIQSKYNDGVLLIEIGKKEVRLPPLVALPGWTLHALALGGASLGAADLHIRLSCKRLRCHPSDRHSGTVL